MESRAKGSGAEHATTGGVDPLENIAALIDGGGQIMLGSVEPIRDAAVAHDGVKTLAMLRRQQGETVQGLLARLDRAIATAKTAGNRVDEINVRDDRSYDVARPAIRPSGKTSRR